MPPHKNRRAAQGYNLSVRLRLSLRIPTYYCPNDAFKEQLGRIV